MASSQSRYTLIVEHTKNFLPDSILYQTETLPIYVKESISLIKPHCDSNNSVHIRMRRYGDIDSTMFIKGRFNPPSLTTSNENSFDNMVMVTDEKFITAINHVTTLNKLTRPIYWDDDWLDNASLLPDYIKHSINCYRHDFKDDYVSILNRESKIKKHTVYIEDSIVVHYF